MRNRVCDNTFLREAYLEYGRKMQEQDLYRKKVVKMDKPFDFNRYNHVRVGDTVKEGPYTFLRIIAPNRAACSVKPRNLAALWHRFNTDHGYKKAQTLIARYGFIHYQNI